MTHAAVEIEEAVSALAEQTFDALRVPPGDDDQTAAQRFLEFDIAGGVLQNNIHIAVCHAGEVSKAPR